MLGTTISPYTAIPMNEAMVLLGISRIDYETASIDGLLKKSVEIQTVLNNTIGFHNFWDLLEFSINRVFSQRFSYNTAILAAGIVDEIARNFDQRDQENFHFYITELSEIFSYFSIESSPSTEISYSQRYCLICEIFVAFCSLVSKCAAAWLCCTNTMKDSSNESSVVAGRHEQADCPWLCCTNRLTVGSSLSQDRPIPRPS